jgi:hypothetical protein
VSFCEDLLFSGPPLVIRSAWSKRGFINVPHILIFGQQGFLSVPFKRRLLIPSTVSSPFSSDWYGAFFARAWKILHMSKSLKSWVRQVWSVDIDSIFLFFKCSQNLYLPIIRLSKTSCKRSLGVLTCLFTNWFAVLQTWGLEPNANNTNKNP